MVTKPAVKTDAIPNTSLTYNEIDLGLVIRILRIAIER